MKHKLKSELRTLLQEHKPDDFPYSDDPFVNALYKLEGAFAHHLASKIARSRKRKLPYFYDRLKTLYQTRWDLIKGTDLQYTHCPGFPMSRFFDALARRIGPKVMASRLEILMYTLKEVKPRQYLSDSYTRDFKLYDLLLNDDATALMIISDCLDFAKLDGILKHVYLGEDDAAIKLSAEERQRLLNRTPTATLLYDAITTRNNRCATEDSEMARHLRMLTAGLRAGGVEANGLKTEYDAGKEADFAIVQFFELYNNYWEHIKELNDKVQKEAHATFDALTLIEIQGPGKEPKITTLSELIERLRNPKYEVKIDEETGRKTYIVRDTIYCVEEIAKRIEEILAKNEEIIYSPAFLKILHEMRQEIDAHYKRLPDALKRIVVHPYTYHQEAGQLLLLQRLLDNKEFTQSIHCGALEPDYRTNVAINVAITNKWCAVSRNVQHQPQQKPFADALLQLLNLTLYNQYQHFHHIMCILPHNDCLQLVESLCQQTLSTLFYKQNRVRLRYQLNAIQCDLGKNIHTQLLHKLGIPSLPPAQAKKRQREPACANNSNSKRLKIHHLFWNIPTVPTPTIVIQQTTAINHY